jgi:hypothetical protein
LWKVRVTNPILTPIYEMYIKAFNRKITKKRADLAAAARAEE